MSAGISAAAWVGIAAIIGAGAAVTQSEDAKRARAAQEAAQKAAKLEADRQQKAAEEAFNAQNKKKPDISGIVRENSAANAGGASGTMLTGAAGVDPNALSLSKTTLLGG